MSDAGCRSGEGGRDETPIAGRTRAWVRLSTAAEYVFTALPYTSLRRYPAHYCPGLWTGMAIRRQSDAVNHRQHQSRRLSRRCGAPVAAASTAGALGSGRRARWLASTLARTALISAVLAVCVTADAAAGADFRNWRTLRDQGVVKQSLDFSCGAAALATLLNRFRASEVTERELLEVLADPASGLRLPQGWRESGMSFATLAGLALHYETTAVGIELSASDLSQLRVPAIAYLPNSDPPHFTVITGIDPRGSIELADPGWGNRRMRAARFKTLWLDASTGLGRLMLLHSKDPDATAPALAFRRFYPRLRPSYRSPW